MITVINPTKFIIDNKLDGPVTSPQIFLGKSKTFHPHGLFSEEIFGLENSPDRRNKLSWIDLNCNVITPSIYDILTKRVFRNLPDLLSGKISYSIEPSGELLPNPEGNILGFSSFVENIKNIRFRLTDDDSTDRNDIINMIHSNIKKNTFFMDKVIVPSPGFRPISIGENDIVIDEMNNIYTRIINLSVQIKGTEGIMMDTLNYKMQLLVKDLFEFVKVKVSKKQGMLRDQLLGKRVDLSARSVITVAPNMPLGYVGLPLSMCANIFSPFLLYGLVNSKESQHLPNEFYAELKNYLAKQVDPEMLID